MKRKFARFAAARATPALAAAPIHSRHVNPSLVTGLLRCVQHRYPRQYPLARESAAPLLRFVQPPMVCVERRGDRSDLLDPTILGCKYADPDSFPRSAFSFIGPTDALGIPAPTCSRTHRGVLLAAPLCRAATPRDILNSYRPPSHSLGLAAVFPAPGCRAVRGGDNQVLPIVGTWLAKLPRPLFRYHMFTFHSDGTILQSNPNDFPLAAPLAGDSGAVPLTASGIRFYRIAAAFALFSSGRTRNCDGLCI